MKKKKVKKKIINPLDPNSKKKQATIVKFHKKKIIKESFQRPYIVL